MRASHRAAEESVPGEGAQATDHCRPPQERGGKKLLGPGEVLLLLKGEHRRDETRGGLAKGANKSRLASAVGACKGIRLAVTLLYLA